MPTVQTEAIVRYIHSLVGNPAFKNLTDGELLKRFVGAGEEAAFTELLRRHGRLVWGVCRRILHHEQEAEDAFQIVFLVLTNRAKSIRKQASVSSWLYGVAYRVAVRIKQKARKRRACEEQALRASPTNTVSEACFHELQAILDDELNRLPEKYRAPFVLCYFEARSGQEAARELGLRERTLSSRLAQARKMLQKRLRRRGATLTAGLCAMALAQETAATALPPALFEATRAAALLEITGKASAPLAPGIVATVEEILRSMAITKLKVFGAMILATSLVAAGAGMLTARVLCERPERKLLLSTLPVQVTSEPKEPAKEAYTGLDCFGDPLPPGAIARLGSLRLYHGQQISCVTVAPDSQTAVGSVQPGGESRLWSLATGKEQPLPMHLKAAFFFAAGG
jgi:RNA polymerase sigma factor (sigma-70 family)